MFDNRIKINWLFFLSFLLLVMLLVSCTGTQEDIQPTSSDIEEKPLIINMNVAPGTLDPAWAVDGAEFLQNFYVRLTQYAIVENEDGTERTEPGKPIQPYLAKSWEISEDGKAYTFHLQEDTAFSSGNPVNAEAVKYSLERLLGIDGVGAYYVLLGIYDPYLIQSIEAPEEYTVVITLSRAEPNFLQGLTMPAASIVDPSVVEANGGWAVGEINEYMASHVAGSGPFLLEEYQPNVKAVLVANPDFFGDHPGSDRVIVNFINSEETLLLQARSGIADVTIGLSGESVNSLENDPNVRVVVNETTYSERLGMADTKPPLDNVKFREALSYAIPYEDILKDVAYGYGVLYYGPFPPSMAVYNPEIAGPRTYDLDKARALIIDSGVETPVDIEVVFVEGNDTHEKILTILQSIWSELGINLKLRQLSSSDFTNAVEGHTAQMHMRTDGTGVYDAGYFMGFDMVCALIDSYNVNEVCIPGADEIIDQARQELDPEARQLLWDEIQQMWVDNSPFVPVYLIKNTTVLNDRVDRFVWSHMQEFRFISTK